MTLKVISQGHSPFAGLFKCNPSNICAAFYQISSDSASRGPSATAGLLVVGIVFRTGEAKQFKFVVQIDVDKSSASMMNYHQRGIVLGSHDLLEFVEITDNVSEAVQDRDLLTVED